jgi:ribosome biogenesis protein BMS1
MDDGLSDKKKGHNKAHSGRKADKKKQSSSKEGSDKPKAELTARQKNPKAFSIQNVQKTEKRVRRKEDIGEKRARVPVVDRTPTEPPPIVIAIVGPPKVGKSTLLQCLVKNFTRQSISNIQGPVTIVSGKKRRLTFIECSNDVNMMIDVAKVADLVLILIDASFGFEMEVFEFLNICQVMPKTHSTSHFLRFVF